MTLRQKGGESPWSAGVYRSEDGGRTWQPRSNGLKQLAGKPGSNNQLCTWTDCLAVDPRNPDVVWTGGASWWYTGVYGTSDGGLNWKRAFPTQRFGWITFWGPTVMCLSLSSADPARLAFGTSGMVYVTEDGADTWAQRYSEERTDGKLFGTGLEVTCLHSVTPSRSPSIRLTSRRSGSVRAATPSLSAASTGEIGHAHDAHRLVFRR